MTEKSKYCLRYGEQKCGTAVASIESHSWSLTASGRIGRSMVEGNAFPLFEV